MVPFRMTPHSAVEAKTAGSEVESWRNEGVRFTAFLRSRFQLSDFTSH